jgi:hypothetical protein
VSEAAGEDTRERPPDLESASEKHRERVCICDSICEGAAAAPYHPKPAKPAKLAEVHARRVGPMWPVEPVESLRFARMICAARKGPTHSGTKRRRPT